MSMIAQMMVALEMFKSWWMDAFKPYVAEAAPMKLSDDGSVAIDGLDGSGKGGGKGGKAKASGKGSRAIGGKGGDA